MRDIFKNLIDKIWNFMKNVKVDLVRIITALWGRYGVQKMSVHQKFSYGIHCIIMIISMRIKKMEKFKQNKKMGPKIKWEIKNISLSPEEGHRKKPNLGNGEFLMKIVSAKIM